MEEFEIYIDEAGRIIVPSELAKQYGLKPGIRSLIGKDNNGLRLRRPVTHLAKVYVEVTNRCNLECVTCIRHSWDEPLGEMSSIADLPAVLHLANELGSLHFLITNVLPSSAM